MTLRNPVLVLPALWVALAAGLAAITGRVGDWFVMTDELLYERLAISVARTVSPLPRVHGTAIPSLAQLYPVLIAPFYRSGLVPHDLHDAHLFNAWLMSSACIPAFFLARRATGRTWAGWVLAVLAVTMPWIFYASSLLTEVAGYPFFLWALLGMHRSLTAPSARNDVLALAGIVLAFLARTQFIVLGVVLPLALLTHEAGLAGPGFRRKRARAVLLGVVRRHRVLAGVYAALAAVVVILAAAGRASSPLGLYGSTLSGIPHGLARGLLQHLVMVGLGIGMLPAVVGLGWLFANLVRPSGSASAHAFACLGAFTVVGLVIEVTLFDLRLGAGPVVYDRYLFYLAPVLVLATLCALVDAKPPRWSVAAGALVVAGGFAIGAPPGFEWHDTATLSPDAPASVFYRPLVSALGSVGTVRASLALAAIVLGGLFVLGARFRRRALTGSVVALMLVALPVETAYVLDRYFTQKDWALRSITYHAAGIQDWVDLAAGPRARVTQLPSPVSNAYFVNEQAWRDLEFWNASVDRTAYYGAPTGFAFTGIRFSKIALRIDPSTGALNVSPTPWVVQSVNDTRFRIEGVAPGAATPYMAAIDAGTHWRAQWMSSGLYDDGWTKPGVTVHVRVFPRRGQAHAETRTLIFAIRPPDDVERRAVTIISNLQRWRGVATNTGDVFANVHVCVPAHGSTEVALVAHGSSAIPGDLDTLAASLAPRSGGVGLGEIALADEIGGRC